MTSTGSVEGPAMMAAAAEEASNLDVNRASRRLSYLYGAPTSEWHAADQIATAQYQQQAGEMQNWLDQVAPSLPGFERDDVQELTAHAIKYMTANGWRTGDHWQDLQMAYGTRPSTMLAASIPSSTRDLPVPRST